MNNLDDFSNRQRKIIIISHRFPPLSQGGTENYSFNLAMALKQKGFLPFIICIDDINSGQQKYQIDVDHRQFSGLNIIGFKLNYQKAPRKYEYLYLYNPFIEEKVFNIVKEISPDIIHITSLVHHSISLLNLCNRISVPTVLTLTDYWLKCPKTTLLKDDFSLCGGQRPGVECWECMFNTSRFAWITKKLPNKFKMELLNLQKIKSLYSFFPVIDFITTINRRKTLFLPYLRNVDYIISPSKFLKQEILKTYLLEDKLIKYQPHGHNTIIAAAGKEKSKSSILRFGYIGHLAYHKGVHILIEAFRTLQGQNAILKIYGEILPQDSYANYLKELAQGYSKITFEGRFDHNDIGEILKNIDVVVVPSIWYENAPLVISEAFAAKTPVIATDLGGMAELIENGKTGFLFERGKSEKLAQTIELLIKKPTMIDAFKENIPDIKDFDVECSELISLYQRLM